MTDNQSGTSVPSIPLAWAVIGSSGFVGSGIVQALEEVCTSQIREITAPRIAEDLTNDIASRIWTFLSQLHIEEAIEDLSHSLSGSDVVVNAAGIAAPDSKATRELLGANTFLPVIVAEAAKRAGVKKVLHISSAAVQGPKDVLDETGYVQPFSAYSQSKANGERVLELWRNRQTQDNPHQSIPAVTVIRATSVQGAGRETSQTLQRVARSRLSTISSPGDQPTVVSSREGLARFVVAMGCYQGSLPPILLQPWEGASVRHVLELAGDGRRPLVIPRWLAKAGVLTFQAFGKVSPRSKGIARRLEVMWFGQKQVSGWAIDTGVVPKNRSGPSEMLSRALSTKS